MFSGKMIFMKRKKIYALQRRKHQSYILNEDTILKRKGEKLCSHPPLPQRKLYIILFFKD